MDMLADVKQAIGTLQGSTPTQMPLGGGNRIYVAQVEANKLSLAMKRRRMKSLPSMPTQQDVHAAIQRLQKDASQALDGEAEIRKSLDFVNALSLTLMQSFNAMAAVAEACVEEAASTRAEASAYTKEVRSFKEKYVGVFEDTIAAQGEQIKALQAEVATMKGSAKTARIGAAESLHDVSATSVKLVADLQCDMTESLDHERSDRARHQHKLTERVAALEKETIAGLQQVAVQAQRTVEKEVSKVARALSELVDQVGTTCEDVKDDCGALRDELRNELTNSGAGLNAVRSQLDSIQHELGASSARVHCSEKRQEAILTATERQNQKVQDEISHMYSILSRQLSEEMSQERSRVLRGGTNLVIPRPPSPSSPSYNLAGSDNGPVSPGNNRFEAHSTVDELTSNLDEDVRMLEAKLENMLQPY